ncbi:hypothetical protein FACS1894199_17970 [Bacteroidia bacterium]|nr:hypothetical protein FACS1894199_17970 [Bacteroidia bacterium]
MGFDKFGFNYFDKTFWLFPFFSYFCARIQGVLATVQAEIIPIKPDADNAAVGKTASSLALRTIHKNRFTN